MEYNKRIDGFFLLVKPYREKGDDNEHKHFRLNIYYKAEQKIFHESVYKGLTEKKVKDIEKKLNEYKEKNKNIESVCVITLATIINEIERIVYES